MAMAGHCRVLLLDEPTAGMTAAESLAAAELLREVHTDYRLPVLIVEHDMAFIRAVADRVTVLARGLAAGRRNRGRGRERPRGGGRVRRSRPLMRLEATDLRSGYGTVPVLHGVSLTVSSGEIVALVGRNGAGKTTLVKTVLGVLRSTGGVSAPRRC